MSDVGEYLRQRSEYISDTNKRFGEDSVELPISLNEQLYEAYCEAFPHEDFNKAINAFMLVKLDGRVSYKPGGHLYFTNPKWMEVL